VQTINPSCRTQLAQQQRVAEAEAAQAKTKEQDASDRAAQLREQREFWPDHELRPEEQIAIAKQKFGPSFDKQINIAVIGERGQGKSTFINAIRGLRPRAAGASLLTGSHQLPLWHRASTVCRMVAVIEPPCSQHAAMP
jgi:ABC-type transport system involved in cytochrome bd biosynthesis fused ATPase/permease subunit